MIDVRLPHEDSYPSRACRVLFDCPAAWPVLWPDVEGGIGGAEVRAVTFARELAQRPEFDVHFLVRQGSPSADAASFAPARQLATIGADSTTSYPALASCAGACATQTSIHGITIHFESRCADGSKGAAAWWSGARRLSDRLAGSFTKRWSGIPERHRLVESLNYDVLCCFGVTNRTASLVRSAHQAGRQAIVFLTSDRTLDDVKLRGARQRGAYGELGFLCRFALQSADGVVVQKRSQQHALMGSLGIHSRLIRNPIDLNPVPIGTDPAERPSAPYVLWVGRADTFSKRADRCWQLARKCPNLRFVAIMNRHDDTTFEQLRTTQPSNVTLIPYVRPQHVEAYYRGATLLINTSDAEGFPNSFLQAGKYGVPVVSLKEDPDGVLHRHDAGVCCHGSLATMRDSVLDLMQQGPDYQRMSKKVLRYTQSFHGLRERCDELSRLIREVDVAARAVA